MTNIELELRQFRGFQETFSHGSAGTNVKRKVSYEKDNFQLRMRKKKILPFSNIEILRGKRDQKCRILQHKSATFCWQDFFFIKKDYFHFLSSRFCQQEKEFLCSTQDVEKKTSRCCPSYDNVDGKFGNLNKGMKMKRKTKETSLHSAQFSHLSEAEEQRRYGSECPSCFRVGVVKICKTEIRKEIIAQSKCEEYEK